MSELFELSLSELVQRMVAMSAADRDHVLARLGPDALNALQPSLEAHKRQNYSGPLTRLIDDAKSGVNPGDLAPGVAEFLSNISALEVAQAGGRDARPAPTGSGLLLRARKIFSERLV